MPATDGITNNNLQGIRTAALAVLRDLTGTPHDIDDEALIKLSIVYRRVGGQPNAIAHLLTIIKLSDAGLPILDGYPDDYEARAHALYLGRRQ